MLSYQHIYHAGGWADLQKHAALCALWDAMGREAASPKVRRTYIDTHSGRGAYDLGAVEALKTAEFETGIAHLAPARLPKLLHPYGAALKFWTPLYPGSAGCIAALRRKGEEMALCELHPGEVKHLRQNLGRKPQVRIIQKNGHEAVIDALPRDAAAQAATLVLVDPSYEVKAEYAQTAQTALHILERAPQAKILIWYPVLAGAAHHEALLEGLSVPLKHGALHSLMNAPGETPPPKGMIRSGLILLNPPEGFAKGFDGVSELLQRILSRGAGRRRRG
ncbi:MAG: 23S rRNA (adenine(2030)-N(6))-methyltransferase RlmJ [Alphaproteobacteria bacterium]|nr:23S rRNA (adenine(2030)-N(6))-methyltransferase RlmJ [Alphaproteobacteria bacterium]